MHSSHELGTPPSSVQWPFQLSVAFLAVTASRHPKLSHRLQPPLKAANLRSGSRLPFSKASNLRRASIHEPLGGPKVLSYGFQTASCPPRKLQILRSASSLPPLQNLRSASSLSPSTAPTKKTSIHEPLGGRKVFSYGFETAACPPRNPNPPQRLEPAPLQPVPLNSSNKKNIHPRAAGWPQSRFSRFRDRRLPPSKASNPPQRLEPAPLSGSRLPSSKASNLRVELCPQYHPPYSVTQSMSLVPFPAASSGLSRSQWPFWL